MLWKVSEISVLKLDSHRFDIADVDGSEDVAAVPCQRCGRTGTQTYHGDITQYGLERDCNIVLVQCGKCMHQYAIRFHTEVETNERE